MSERAPYSSECPKCGHERVQGGLSTEELREMLDTGAAIDACCVSCDEHWLISTDERADIARALERLDKRQ
jgi:redox-regulated HSP33 family molecular chaperone